MLAELSGDYTQGTLPEPITSPSGKFFIVFVTNNGITAQGFEAYYAPETVGIGQSFASSDSPLSVFPNPAKDDLTISLSGQVVGETQLTLFNLEGATIYEMSLNANQGAESYTINISDFMPGLYVLIVRNGNEFYRQELVIH